MFLPSGLTPIPQGRAPTSLIMRTTVSVATSMTAIDSPRPLETKMCLPSGASAEPIGLAGSDFPVSDGIMMALIVLCLIPSRTVTAAPLSAVAKAVEPSLVNTTDLGLNSVCMREMTVRVAVSGHNFAFALAGDVHNLAVRAYGYTLRLFANGNLPLILPVGNIQYRSLQPSPHWRIDRLTIREKSKASGSCPLGKIRKSLWVVRSTTPTPSAARSGGGSFDSSTPRASSW